MARLRTSLSQFALVGGRRRNHSEAVACREPSRRPLGASRAHLYLLAEHADADGQAHDFCAIVMQEIQLAFADQEQQGAGAATALVRALESVNQALWQENQQRPSHKRLPIGLVAIAIDGADAYICQIATGQTFVGRGEALAGVPELGYWHDLYLGDRVAGPALGQTDLLDPALYHCRLQAGDLLLLLCTSNLARLVDADAAASLPGQPLEGVIGQLCGLAEGYGLQHTSGLALQILQTPMRDAVPAPLAVERLPIDELEGTVGMPRPNLAHRLGGLLTRPLTETAPADDLAAAAHEEAALAPEADEARAPEPVLAGAGSSRAEGLPDNVFVLYRTPPLAAPEPDELAPEEPARPAATARRPAAAAGRSRQARWMDALAASVVWAADTARRSPLPARQPVVVASGEASRPARRRTASAGGRPAAPEAVFPRTADLAPATASGPALAGTLALGSRWSNSTLQVAVVLAVVAAVLVVAAAVVSLLPNRPSAVPIAATPVSAPASLAQPAQAQVAGEAGRPAAADAAPIRPATEYVADWPVAARYAAPPPTISQEAQAAAEREAAQAAQDAAQRISRLSSVALLADLSASGTSPTTPKQLILGPNGLYVLDPYTSTLYLVAPDGKEATPLLTKGWTIAKQKVGDLIGATWRGDTLVVMDRERAYTLDGPKGTWRISPLAGAKLGLGVHPVGSFAGNLYVLDSASRQLYKFTQGAYNQTPQPWLRASEHIDLSGAVDMAIDGKIYALTASGQIMTLSRGGLEQTLTPAVTPALQAPAALVNPAGSPFLYVAETSGRILQLTKEGTLIRQLRMSDGAGDLTGLSDLAVNEATGSIYAIVGNRVVRLALPGAQPVSGTRPLAD